jgi:hypothetical protein
LFRAVLDRRSRRRRETIEEILAVALEVMAEDGVAVLPAVRDDDEAVSHDADENRASRALLVVMVAPSSSR